MAQTIYQVDSFTSVPFRGNPAAVCLLEAPADDVWMQNVAAEMALSETAFVVPVENEYDLRWFTPVAEVDLCGHATLAAAHILIEKEMADRDGVVIFNTASGQLKATVKTDGSIALDFPAEPPTSVEADDSIRHAIDIPIVATARNRLDVLVEVDSQQNLLGFIPDGSSIADIDTRGLILTARSDDQEIDFVSRFFAPRLGIMEDPVTGSAHCGLGPYWAEKLAKSKLKARQLSQRGGDLCVELVRDRVLLTGHAVTTMKVLLLA